MAMKKNAVQREQELSLRSAREAAGLSLREAAKRANITHAYLSGLELGHKPLLPDRSRQLAALYGLDVGVKLAQPVPQDKGEFVDWLREQIKWWDSRFVMPMMPGVTKAISNLYVEPAFLLEDGQKQNALSLMESFLGDTENRAMLLAGHIGTGKSFFMRMLALDTDNLCVSAPKSKKYIPILVSLGEYSQSAAPLARTLAEYYVQHGYPGSLLQLEVFFQQCLERGNALLLMDGLDEIDDHHQRVLTLARLQREFDASIRRSGNRLIISGREDAFYQRDRSHRGFELVHIQRWKWAQMFDASQRWEFGDESNLNLFLHVLQSSEYRYTLANWPLLFHLLTTLHSTSGLRPFQALAGLCDDCCMVLENTWSAARRTFHRAGAGSRSDSLGSYSWLKWRHFLIFLMQKAVEKVRLSGEPVPFSFSNLEMREAWEEFLLSKGVSRTSLEFTKLEDLIGNQERIGPIFQVRGHAPAGGADRFSFLDPVFGLYYCAKALINAPEKLESTVLSNLRRPQWEEIIPLTIQELGRSERPFENEAGEKLLSTLLSGDDSLGLEHTHGIGKFGLFAATRGVLTYNLEKYWDKIIEPFLDCYMRATFEHEGTTANRILGEFSAEARVRQFFLDLYSKGVRNIEYKGLSGTFTKWRVLAALGRFGGNADEIVDELVSDIEAVVKKQENSSYHDSIQMRRLLWSVRQVDRVFLLEGNAAPIGKVGKTKWQRIDRIAKAMLSFVDFVVDQFETEVRSKSFGDVTYWDVLTVVLETAEGLQYNEVASQTVNRVCKSVADNFDCILKEYPDRVGVWQFLKGAARHAASLDDSLSSLLVSKLKTAASEVCAEELLDINVILALLENATWDSLTETSELFERVCGRCDEVRFNNWVDIVRKQKHVLSSNYLELGWAITGISLFHNRYIQNEKDRVALISDVLTAFQVERQTEERLREAVRTYTAPFSSYGYPLYDHMYNCLTVLARYLPLNKVC